MFELSLSSRIELYLLIAAQFCASTVGCLLQFLCDYNGNGKRIISRLMLMHLFIVMHSHLFRFPSRSDLCASSLNHLLPTWSVGKSFFFCFRNQPIEFIFAGKMVYLYAHTKTIHTGNVLASTQQAIGCCLLDDVHHPTRLPCVAKYTRCKHTIIAFREHAHVHPNYVFALFVSNASAPLLCSRRARDFTALNLWRFNSARCVYMIAHSAYRLPHFNGLCAYLYFAWCYRRSCVDFFLALHMRAFRPSG